MEHKKGFISTSYGVILSKYLCCVKFLPLSPSCCFVCGVRALLFVAFASVYHSKQATEISLWKPVYGLPPHMLAVSFRGGQAGNERLLLGGDKPRLCIFLCHQPPHVLHLHQILAYRSLLFSLSLCLLPCFPKVALENVMQGGRRGVFLFGPSKGIRPQRFSWTQPWNISGAR